MASPDCRLVSKEETVEEILKDIYYGAAEKIQKEAARWAGLQEMTKTAFFYLQVKEPSTLEWDVSYTTNMLSSRKQSVKASQVLSL